METAVLYTLINLVEAEKVSGTGKQGSRKGVREAEKEAEKVSGTVSGKQKRWEAEKVSGTVSGPGTTAPEMKRVDPKGRARSPSPDRCRPFGYKPIELSRFGGESGARRKWAGSLQDLVTLELPQIRTCPSKRHPAPHLMTSLSRPPSHGPFGRGEDCIAAPDEGI